MKKKSDYQDFMSLNEFGESKQQFSFQILISLNYLLEEMGNTNNSTELSEENLPNLVLGVDLEKEVQPNLKQLLNWSLSEIRQIYSFFRRRKNSPVLNRTEFSRLIGLSRTTSFYLFPFLDQKQGLTVFQVISILVLTSYANISNKIHFLFIVFDLTSKKFLQLSETIILYKSIVRGYCKLTSQNCPESIIIQKYAKSIFTKSELNEDQGLEIQEIADAFQNNYYSNQLFMRFEPKHKINQQYSSFNNFLPYTQFERLQIEKLILSSENNHQSILITPKQSKFPKLDQIKNTQHTKSKSHKNLKEGSPLKHKTLNDLRLRDINLGRSSKNFIKHKKISNVLIIKGTSVTKKQVFQLKDYFEKLSNGSKIISMQQFLEAFSGEKFDHMRSVTASLFNFLDRKQTGKITFIDLLYKIYPSLSNNQLQIIKEWVKQYEKMYNAADHNKKLEKKDEIKIKTLPKSCMIRVKQIFDLFDKEKKGWISLENLKECFSEVFTENQVIEMFKKRDTDNDGKLKIQQFVRILLPSDIEIEGCKLK